MIHASRLPFLAILPVLCFSITVAAAASGDRVALVIGVDKYENLDEASQLQVAVKDAELMAKTLQALDPPFEVTLLTDTTQDEAEDALDQFLDSADEADCALVYYAGHGIEYHGENFLLVSDTDIEKLSGDVARMKRRLGNEAISLQAWVDSFDTTGADVKIVILDACRDNPLKATDANGTRSVVGGKGGLAQVTPPSGSLIAYSADAGQQANDGLFTTVLAEKLIIPGLPLLEVFAATREEVLKLSGEMAEKQTGVRHEPAEYTKLNVSGTRFTFMKGEGDVVGRPMPDADSGEIAVLKREIEMLKEKAAAGEAVPERSVDESVAGRTPGEVREFKGMEFIWCPPTGEEGFMMGSPESEPSRDYTEVRHKVILTEGFWLAKKEVTQGQWKEHMVSSIRDLATRKDDSGSVAGEGPDYPVYFVSWHDAKQFVDNLNAYHSLPDGWEWTLPTEAQWEYACRAGTNTTFSTGDNLSSTQANINGRYPYRGGPKGPYRDATTKVGSYPPNPWGLYDMNGNVREWTMDFYSDRFLTPDTATDPLNEFPRYARVARGGCYQTGAEAARSADRTGQDAQARISAIGMRLAIARKR